MTPSISRWYVVQCKPRQDFRALEHLQRQGYSCYLPTLCVEKRQRGRKLEVYDPLFPQYLFIQLDQINDNWAPIRSTCGVKQIVRFNGTPLPVPDELVGSIRRRLKENAPRLPYLRPGEPVRVISGCFSDVDAIFLREDGTERVLLLMNMLHREQILSFPSAIVRKGGNV